MSNMPDQFLDSRGGNSKYAPDNNPKYEKTSWVERYWNELGIYIIGTKIITDSDVVKFVGNSREECLDELNRWFND